MNLICKLFGHKLKIKSLFDKETRKLGKHILEYKKGSFLKCLKCDNEISLYCSRCSEKL